MWTQNRRFRTVRAFRLTDEQMFTGGYPRIYDKNIPPEIDLLKTSVTAGGKETINAYEIKSGQTMSLDYFSNLEKMKIYCAFIC